MIEVKSIHPYVGRVVTCQSCMKSFKIEAGDYIGDFGYDTPFVEVPCCKRATLIPTAPKGL